MAKAAHTFEQFAKSVMSRLLPLSFAQREEMQVLINQGIDPIEARALVQSYVQKDAGFDEGKHPRDHGKFSEGGGSSASASPGGGSTGTAAAAPKAKDTRTYQEHFAARDAHLAAYDKAKEEAKAQPNLAAKFRVQAEGSKHLEAAKKERIAGQKKLDAADKKAQPKEIKPLRSTVKDKGVDHEAESGRNLKQSDKAIAAADKAAKAGRFDEAQKQMDKARAHIDESKAHNAARLKQVDNNIKRQERREEKAPPPKTFVGPEGGAGDKRFASAERHLEQANRHKDEAAKAKEAGKVGEANAHVELAGKANAAAKRELTLERSEHEAANKEKVARGEAATPHNDEVHAALTAQHADNRAKLRATDSKNDKAQSQSAVGHTKQAEASIGQARAAAAAGDKAGEKAHLDSAKASVKQAETTLKVKPTGAENAKAHTEAKLRNAATQELLHPGVNSKPLRAAEKSHGRAQAHEKASRAHAEAGHTARATHHATEAAHANHETGKHLAEFGKLIAEVADKSLEKSAGPKRASQSDALTHAYLKAFYTSAEARLPKWQASHLKGRAKRAVEKDRLKKDGLLMGDVHVPVPLKARKEARPAARVVKPLPHIRLLKNDAAEMAYVNQALNLQDPTYRAPEGNKDTEGATPPSADIALEAHRLVQGMDMEMSQGAADAEHARKTASRMLLDRPGYYDTVGASPELLGDKGVMLDLGSGASRAMGHIGIDLHPYDYGTVLYDLDLGIPFPDGCARAVRMTHSLHPILDAYGTPRSPVALLLEVQRVLREGGQLYYEGPEPLYEKGDPWPIPGLAIVSDTADTALTPNANAPVLQVFRRVPLRVPAFAGADALYAPAPPMPIDAAMAMLAANAQPAELAMANLVAKAEVKRVVPIVKADNEKQICYGEVLNPLTIDSQDDWLTAADIEKAAHDYMMTSRVIGSEHGEPIRASVVESFVAPQDLDFVSPAGPVSVPKGTWLIGVKVADPAEWAKVKSGEYSGFSVGGFGVREPGAPDALAA